MNKIISLMIFVFMHNIYAFDIDPRCNLPKNLCEKQLQFESSDKKLNLVYKKIIKKINNNGFRDFEVDKKELKKTLVSSQRSWLKFKEKNCHAYYVLNSGGTSKDLDELQCQINMTNSRIRYLKRVYLIN